jgi:glycine/D-amino acid oxidase-like deaminating enzyme
MVIEGLNALPVWRAFFGFAPAEWGDIVANLLGGSLGGVLFRWLLKLPEKDESHESSISRRSGGETGAIRDPLHQLKTDDVGLYRGAIDALVEQGPSVLNALAEAVTQPHADLRVRFALPEILGRIGGARASDLLKRLLENPEEDYSVQLQTMERLALLDGPGAMPSFIDAVRDYSRGPAIRYLALQALQSVVEQLPDLRSIPAETLTDLRELLNDVQQESDVFLQRAATTLLDALAQRGQESGSAARRELSIVSPIQSLESFSFRDRERMWDRLREHPEIVHDVAVAGGGAAAAMTAWDASLRGLSVVVAEKNTWAAGTTSRSTDMIHAGIRYPGAAWHDVWQGKWRSARSHMRLFWIDSRERGIWPVIAPDLVRLIPFVFPVFAHDPQSPFRIFMFVLVYSLGAWAARNPLWRLWRFTRAQMLGRFPDLNPEGLKGGFGYWDGVTDGAALTRRAIHSAYALGAQTLNYVEMIDATWHDEDGGYYAVTLKNRMNDEELTIRSKTLVLATGPWADKTVQRVSSPNGPQTYQPLVKRVAGAHVDVLRDSSPAEPTGLVLWG